MTEYLLKPVSATVLLEHLQNDVSLQLFEEVEECEDKKDGIYAFERGIDGWAFLITSSNDFIEEKTAKLKNKLENISQKYSELDFFGGIGGVVPRMFDGIGNWSIYDSGFDNNVVCDMNVAADQLPVYKAIVVVIIVTLQSPVFRAFIEKQRAKSKKTLSWKEVNR